MSKHTPVPWTENTAKPIIANDYRLLIGGEPPHVACRILSEANYQLAMRCVNAHDDLLTACKRAENWLTVDVDGREQCGPLVDALRIVRAAIAKAEGKDVDRD